MKRVDRITITTKEKVPVDFGDLNYLLVTERFYRVHDITFEIFRMVFRECLTPKTRKESL
jgi:hypothetical protein